MLETKHNRHNLHSKSQMSRTGALGTKGAGGTRTPLGCTTFTIGGTRGAAGPVGAI